MNKCVNQHFETIDEVNEDVDFQEKQKSVDFGKDKTSKFGITRKEGMDVMDEETTIVRYVTTLILLR